MTDDIANQKATYKYSDEDYDFVRSLHGKLSVRSAASLFNETFPEKPGISPSMVHHIWSGKRGGGIRNSKVCTVCHDREEWGAEFPLYNKQYSKSDLLCLNCLELQVKTEKNKKRREQEVDKAEKQLRWLQDEDFREFVMEDIPHELRLEIWNGTNPNNYTFSELFPDGTGGKTSSRVEFDITKGEDIFGAIYAIVLPGSDKVYIGKTTRSISTRFQGHLRSGADGKCGTQEYRDLLKELSTDDAEQAKVRCYLLDLVSNDCINEYGIEGTEKILDEKENAWMFKLLIQRYELFNTRVRVKESGYRPAISYVQEAATNPQRLEDIAIGVYACDEIRKSESLKKSKLVWKFRALQTNDAEQALLTANIAQSV